MAAMVTTVITSATPKDEKKAQDSFSTWTCFNDTLLLALLYALKFKRALLNLAQESYYVSELNSSVSSQIIESYVLSWIGPNIQDIDLLDEIWEH